MRAFFRAVRLAIHALAAVFYCGVVYLFISDEAKDRYVRRWSQKLMAIAGISLKINNPDLISSRALIVSNHISWLDIFLIYSHVNGHFIAKSTMKNWPVFGFLGRKVGTLYLDRTSGRNLKETLGKMMDNLNGNERCIFFPEGTTAEQGNMLPFHPNLFEGAISVGMPIQPFAIRYVMPDGSYAKAVDFFGNIGMGESIQRIFNADGITAELTILPPIDSADKHRKVLAQEVRTVIADSLNSQMEA